MSAGVSAIYTCHLVTRWEFEPFHLLNLFCIVYVTVIVCRSLRLRCEDDQHCDSQAESVHPHPHQTDQRTRLQPTPGQFTAVCGLRQHNQAHQVRNGLDHVTECVRCKKSLHVCFLHSLMTNTVVQAYNTGRPVWSCCWCHDNNNYIYAGLSNGSVLVYDTRDTSTHVQELAPLRSRSASHMLSFLGETVA